MIEWWEEERTPLQCAKLNESQFPRYFTAINSSVNTRVRADACGLTLFAPSSFLSFLSLLLLPAHATYRFAVFSDLNCSNPNYLCLLPVLLSVMARRFSSCYFTQIVLPWVLINGLLCPRKSFSRRSRFHY